MTCDNCHQRPAKYHVTRVVNGERSEQDLCEECALQQGDLALHFEPASAIHELLAGLLEGAAPVLPRVESQHCPTCGLSRAEFARTGMLGCEDCYAAFADTLRPLVRRVQGAGRHHGKSPRAAQAEPAQETAPAPEPAPAQPAAKVPDVASLREQLQAAVRVEDFERAAKLRDRIRELEGGKLNGRP